VDRTIRICSLAALLALAFGTPLNAADNQADVDLFWQAQRADLVGQPESALKSYNKLLGKLPGSGVAVDRLFQLAVLHGDFPSALKAARAQQLSNGGDAALPLIFFVDAWRRKDWAAADEAKKWLEERGAFGLFSPILTAWTDVARGKNGNIPATSLNENGTLAFYAGDQLVYLDLANGDVAAAKKRLTSVPSFGEDYARHMAMSAAEHLSRNGEIQFANAMLDHIGAEQVTDAGKAADFPADQAIAALFSRLSDQLQEQAVPDQPIYFARLAQWIAPDSAFARMTVAHRLNELNRQDDAALLLDGIAENRPQWSWALGDKSRILLAQGREGDALKLIQAARVRQPAAYDLKLLEAQQREANKDLAGAAALYRSLVAGADAAQVTNGRRVTYRLLLAQALNAQQEWGSAKAILEEALAIDQRNPFVLNSLGYGLLERREDVPRGLELVAKAHRIAPDSPAITDSLAWGHYLNGDYAQAVVLLERAVEGAINDVTINEHLGDAYWKVGRTIEARYAWKAAVLQAEGAGAARIASKIDFGWTEATAAP
jgi:tetratricopeptide (TPR) repeat protein